MIKIIILILILLILTIIVQVNNIEFFNGEYQDDIYTSIEFNTLAKGNNIENMNIFTDTFDSKILQTYIDLPYNDMVAKHNDNMNNLFREYCKKEEDDINRMLSKEEYSNIKYVYLNKKISSEYIYYNRAGEYMTKINGVAYVWQPLSCWMLTNSKNNLRNLLKPNVNMPYIECWIMEDIRAGTLDIPSKIKDKYKSSRPKRTDILSYENTRYNFTYVSKNEIRTGDEVIRYIGPRQDNSGRIFDKRAPNISSGNEAFRAIGHDNYDNYYNNDKYKKYIRDSMNYLNNNVKCFGLEWQTGELFYSENNSICDSIENKGNYSRGWPHGWALNFYRIENANDKIDDSFYKENARLDDTEAKKRRSEIKRSNGKHLIVKADL